VEPEPSPEVSSSPNGELERFLQELLERPYERAELERRIEEEFSDECAVLVLDMAGFSRITRQHGVVPYLLMIHQMRLLAIPIVEAGGGFVVEAKADDLLCVFESVGEAVAASRTILSSLSVANVVLPSEFELYASIGIGWGRVLRLGPDRVAGDQVNQAAKLGEDIAGHGEILLTVDAFTALGDSAAAERRRTDLAGLDFDCYALVP
jgi:class 3 adenylate cyclase